MAKEQQQTPSPTEWVCVYQSEVVTHNTSAPQWKPFVLVPHTRACGECDSTHTHVLVTIYAKMHNVLTSYPSSPSVIVSYDIHLDQLHTIGTHLSSPIRTNTNTNTNTGGSSSTTTTATTPVAPDSFFAPNTILFDFFDGEYAVYPSTATPMKTSIAIKGGSGENGDKNEYDDDDGIKRSRSVSPPTRQQHQRPEDENKIVSITSEDSQEQATSLHQNHDARDTTQPPTTTITTAPAINARLIEVDQFRRQLQDLIALRRRLVDLSHRCQQARNSIDAVVAQQSEARHQHAQLRQCAAQAHEIRRKQAVVAQRTDAAQQECVAAERTATVTSQALVSTLQALVSAYRRITAGEASLEGEEGRGRFAVALGALIGRRCLMVSQLGWTLRLTPVASLPHPGAGSTTTASETVTAASSPDALSASLLDEQLDLQWVGASPATAASSPRIGINTSTSASTKNVVKLTICGMSLDSSVWRNAFDPGGGYDWDPTQDRAASVALGYAALFVDRMAEMLGVPLRYPIRFRGSQSVVVDNYPPAGNWYVSFFVYLLFPCFFMHSHTYTRVYISYQRADECMYYFLSTCYICYNYVAGTRNVRTKVVRQQQCIVLQ